MAETSEAESGVVSTRTVGILIFDGVEVLDFCGPFEVFASARGPAAPGADGDGQRLFRVLTVAERGGLVTCSGGLLVQPHHTLADCPPLDLLLVPGGFGTRREQHNPVVLDWIEGQHAAGVLTTSVCTGSFLLAAAGVLAGRRATTHWTTIDELRRQHPAVAVRDDERVVDEGDVVTSAGVSAGIDMALHLVRRLHGADVARWTARDMEYRWDEAIVDPPSRSGASPAG